MDLRFIRLSLALISILAVVNFFPIFSSDYSLDDSYYLSQVEEINTLSDLAKIPGMLFSEVDYRPVSSVTFASEKLLMGEMRAGFSHTVNLLLYIAGAFLFTLLLVRLPLPGSGKHTALLAGLLFTVLPLHCSMVANVKNRDGLLSFMFGMLFLHFLITLFAPKGNVLQKLMLLTGAFAFVLLSIYSKLDGFTFVMLIPALALLYNQSIQWKTIARLALLALLSYRLFMFLFFQWTGQLSEVMPEESIGDPLMFTENPIVSTEDFATKIAFAIQTIFEYMRLMFAPSGHYFYFGYDMIPVRSFADPVIWLKTVVVLLPAAAALFLLKQRPLLSAGIGLFYVGLIYCSNLITPVAGIVADRYAFIASAGACVAAAVLLQIIAQKLMTRRGRAPQVVAAKGKKGTAAAKKSNSLFSFRDSSQYGYALLSGICLIYLPFNVSRAAEWKDIYTLVDADLRHIGTRSYEANRIAVKNYVETAFELQDEKQRREYLQKGVQYGIQAIDIYDNSLLLQEGVVMGYYGLGQWDQATQMAKTVIAKFDTSEVAWRVLSEFYFTNDQFDSAAAAYKRLTELVPEAPEVWLYYVTTLQQGGRYTEALAFTDSIPQAHGLPPYLPEQARTYLYLNYNDSARAVVEIEKGFEKGWREMQFLDIAGRYWWTRDMKKWEEMKRFLN